MLEFIKKNLGVIVIVLVILLIAADIAVAVIALRRKGGADPTEAPKFKNNFCRMINNPSYSNGRWVGKACASGACNKALCKEGDESCNYIDLCNAYGSEDGQTDSTGTCCVKAGNKRKERIAIEELLANPSSRGPDASICDKSLCEICPEGWTSKSPKEGECCPTCEEPKM